MRVERAGAGVVEPLRHPHVDVTQIREFFSRNPRTASSTGSGRARPSFSTWTGSTSPSQAGATGSVSISTTFR